MKINKLYNKETTPINHWVFDKFIDYEKKVEENYFLNLINKNK